jgi:dCMP deaminase
MKTKFLNYFMDIAQRTADLSHARRLHVGAIVVKDDRIISIGYNGMPAGWNNDCEYLITEYCEVTKSWLTTGETKTKDEVLHAETNAIAKLARSNESGLGSDMFITHSPCLDCAKLIFQSGIKRVFYSKAYRDDAGTEFLKKSGIEVTHVNDADV